MHASVGDTLVVEGRRQGHPRRTGRVLEVRGRDGGPPYLVQWDDSPHPVLFFPGSDARIEHPTTA
ncbi:MAG TPA: DUF1918 domain-containing protein [Acidimicrobiales bacterium]|jgi:hypothetical protein